MTLPTYDEVRSLFDFDPESGLFRRLAPAKVCRRADGTCGSASKDGYTTVSIRGRGFYAHRIAWLYVYGEWPAGDIDHINGNRSDNRLCNLRVATRSQNMANQKIRRATASGVKGVGFSQRHKRWVARIWHNKTVRYLGLYKTIAEAQEAYAVAARDLFGEFARVA